MNTFVSGISTVVNPDEQWKDLRQKQKFPWEHFKHHDITHKHQIHIPFRLPYCSHFNMPIWHHHHIVDHIQTDHIIKAEKNISANKSSISANKATIKQNAKSIKTNATNITANKSNINTNKANINTNTTNIAKNVENIAVNKSNIVVNKSKIAENKKEIEDIKDVLDTNIWTVFNE